MKNEWKEKRLLTKVAQMYYDENKTQQEIADKYGISRPSVSRLLQKAREKGIVEIKVHNEFSFTVLEKELEKKLLKNFWKMFRKKMRNCYRMKLKH